MAQFAYPDSDIENPGAWTTEPLWQKIDEEPYDDGDYVISPKTASGKAFTVGLSSVTDPEIHTGHTLRIRARVSAVSGTIKFELLQGAVVIKDSGDIALDSSAFQEHSFTLSEIEAENITDYTALRVRITAVATANNKYQWVSWARLEVPSIGYSITCDSGSYNIVGADVLFRRDYKIGIGVEVYSLGGQIVGLLKDSKIGIDADSYILTGFDANLIYTSGYTLSVEAGSFALSGQVAALEYDRMFSVGAGDYVESGQPLGIYYNRKAYVEAGNFIWTGFDVTLIDAPAAGLDRYETIEKIKQLKPDIIVCETSTPSIENDMEIVKELKNIKVPFIISVGTHVSALADEVLKENPFLDAIARREYEYIVRDLARHLKKNGPDARQEDSIPR